MKASIRTAAVLAAILSVSSSAFAQLEPGGGQAGNSAVSAREVAERADLTNAILKRWKTFVSEAYQTDADQWAGEISRLASYASLDAVRRAAGSRDFDSMNNALLERDSKPVAAADMEAIATANRIGDADTDLVYVPVTPCRIIDTRVAGGQIAANTTRNFDVTAVSNYSAQGGSATNCNVGGSGSFAAAVINFTVVTPGGAGYITAFPYLGAQPLAATVNYNTGDIRGNLAVVKLDQGASTDELSVYTFAATHLVADIVGYFTNPVLDTFQCVTTAETLVNVAASTGGNSNAPACASGYVETATYCESSTWQMPIVYFSGGTCSGQNNSGSTAVLRASRRCCRSAAP